MSIAPNTLEVGLTADGREVVINHPQLLTDEKGAGYIIFSPKQARNLARLLEQKARDAEVTIEKGWSDEL